MAKIIDATISIQKIPIYDDEETEIDYVDVDGEYDVQNSTVYNA